MRALLLVAVLLASAPAFGREGLIDYSSTDAFPAAAFPKGRRYLLHKEPDLGISLVRVRAGNQRGTYKAQADTLTLILHPQVMHVNSSASLKVRRGDFILDHAGEVNGGWRAGAKSTFDMLLVVIPSVFPKKLTPESVPAAISRGKRRALQPIAAARARIDKATGPARRMLLASSPGLKVELLRLTAGVEVENSTPSTSVLFPVQGGATLGVGKAPPYLGEKGLYLMGSGSKLRITPTPGKPFYAILISPGA